MPADLDRHPQRLAEVLDNPTGATGPATAAERADVHITNEHSTNDATVSVAIAVLHHHRTTENHRG